MLLYVWYARQVIDEKSIFVNVNQACFQYLKNRIIVKMSNL